MVKLWKKCIYCIQILGRPVQGSHIVAVQNFLVPPRVKVLDQNEIYQSWKQFLSSQLAAWDKVLYFLRKLRFFGVDPWKSPNRRLRLVVGEEGLWRVGILALTYLCPNLYALFDVWYWLSLCFVPTSLCTFWHRPHCLKISKWFLTAGLSLGIKIVIASSWHIPGQW